MARLLTLLTLVFVLALIAPGCEENVEDSTDGTQDDGTVEYPACSLIPLIDEQSRTFKLISAPPCSFELLGGEARLALRRDDRLEWVALGDYPHARADYTSSSTRWSFSGHNFAPDLELEISPSDEPLGVTFTALLSAHSTAQIEGYEIAFNASRGVGVGGVSAVGFNGGYQMLHNGHDAWSPTQIERIEVGDGAVPRADGRVKACANNYHPGDDCRGVSWWVGAWSVQRDEAGNGGETLAAGALSAHTWKTYIASEALRADGRGNLIVAQGTPGDAIDLAAGSELILDPLFFTVAQNGVDALYDYAQRVAQVVPPLTSGQRPRGWGSWYEFFADVTEQNVLDQLPTIDSEFADAGYTLVQLDDGYMPRWGDWKANDKFPSGLDRLADAISAYGLRPGIWMAPLLVDVESGVYQAHPDWFVRDSAGEHPLFDNLGAASYAYLDVTHPDAADWLRVQISTMVHRGFTYLKLDFLFAGSIEGVRRESVTSMQAYQRAMNLIRDAAGQEVFILACGEPILPSVGQAHAIRTGTDVVSPLFPWPLHVINANLARMNSARFFTSRWFLIDPDNLVVREPLGDDEARLSAVINALGGDHLLLGDDLNQLDAQRKLLLLSPQLIELADARGRFEPLDLFDQYTPVLIKNPAEDVLFFNSRPPKLWWRELSEGSGYLAVVGWRKGLNNVTLRLRDLSAEHSRLVLTELFSDESLELGSDPLNFEIQGPAIKVFRVQPR
ncbi:MAG: alpha-galactosidase [Candidatus Alcyoniella australis]|nr:alpha-galactosidase [Candidatus Alcyoniella australis]